MDILVSRTLYMSCQAGPGIAPGPSALKATAIELTWQTIFCVDCLSNNEILYNENIFCYLYSCFAISML